MGNKPSKGKTPTGVPSSAPATPATPPAAPKPADQEVAVNGIADAKVANEASNEASKPIDAKPAVDPSVDVPEKPLTAEQKKELRKSQRHQKEQQKEAEKQEKKRKEKEAKAIKEAEKRMTQSAKRKSIKSTGELRQESHEKVADVMAFLNSVEQKDKDKDAIAMLDDLIEEDKASKGTEELAQSANPAPESSPVDDDGPHDLVSMLEKLQKLIEDPQMLQRLEELLGQKLTSDGDATKLKSFSSDEMAKIERIIAQDNQWAQRRREEREREIKVLTERVGVADKRKSYLAGAQEEKKPPPVVLPSGSPSVAEKRRSLQLNTAEVNTSLKKEQAAKPAASPSPAAAPSPAVSPVPKGMESPTPLRSAMKKTDSPAVKRKGVTIAVDEAEEEEKAKRTPSGKKLPIEGRRKVEVEEESPKQVELAKKPIEEAKKTEKDAKELEEEERKSNVPAKRAAIVVMDEGSEDSAEKEKKEKERAEKDAENQAKLAAYRQELEERKRKNAAEMRRKAMEKLNDTK